MASSSPSAISRTPKSSKGSSTSTPRATSSPTEAPGPTSTVSSTRATCRTAFTARPSPQPVPAAWQPSKPSVCSKRKDIKPMIERLTPPGVPAPRGPYSPAVRAGDFIFVAGQLAVDPETNQYVPGDIQHETRVTLNNIKKILEGAGATIAD